ncbi:hypothetical protein HPB49_017918 [Dermacentor silvarum]|uniref:Uncharacterized protein n=1 Tax=Dermacentor silvarum TaxID=543639 RepID=A0ACB8DJU7_DERSI|nr:hypothetical protein HPB49_017918 [Dermacentor silvarum]
MAMIPPQFTASVQNNFRRYRRCWLCTVQHYGSRSRLQTQEKKASVCLAADTGLGGMHHIWKHVVVCCREGHSPLEDNVRIFCVVCFFVERVHEYRNFCSADDIVCVPECSACLGFCVVVEGGRRERQRRDSSLLPLRATSIGVCRFRLGPIPLY